jgi:hypothetical protein
VIAKSRVPALVELCAFLGSILLLLTLPSSLLVRGSAGGSPQGAEEALAFVNSPKNFCYICGQFVLK